MNTLNWFSGRIVAPIVFITKSHASCVLYLFLWMGVVGMWRFVLCAEQTGDDILKLGARGLYINHWIRRTERGANRNWVYEHFVVHMNFIRHWVSHGCYGRSNLPVISVWLIVLIVWHPHVDTMASQLIQTNTIKSLESWFSCMVKVTNICSSGCGCDSAGEFFESPESVHDWWN